MDSVGYALATPEDLDEAVNLVEKTGWRIVAEHGDVRDFARLKAAVAHGVERPHDRQSASRGIAWPSGRYITGITLPIDAGFLVRYG